jgi:hypothetical protein
VVDTFIADARLNIAGLSNETLGFSRVRTPENALRRCPFVRFQHFPRSRRVRSLLDAPSKLPAINRPQTSDLCEHFGGVVNVMPCHRGATREAAKAFPSGAQVRILQVLIVFLKFWMSGEGVRGLPATGE